ncbi:MAG: Aspartyl/glutamyl-tRNA(Asn/Gln) amidotransferase subunit C [Candidatus Yanofskybacteria bacterium GW2011_GWF1_44_227]|uniref:Aspartyl/glutamyl-tRNA(Asn/Gln) amidotransferase subunit C n=1 Tax=Candidatus Yanofskybacteria bacterium GW2011_GWE2_40_11 TaxID=1619033 RepID=A0A0G0QJY0_9BACT|nr:MAG: Aspartyl/glutamyl-tRNA(Asn/Gln) amidotransferase subunit C [Candidatus Yanofskybacteria bacterium GW2011_GWE1_40_10]KKR40659.1 MAG: Aspartyl/glutamyl-tRNA(Asn/Gln) amidotransferase subunit C [Candidatus Yanofskybacteria bacterium GW2011_GWE2_40_11]KKT15780.1 MAG: Aspartyl/glutamyl-tRNA(Asn/Gln) amidotransferase subunit C [Candidatus Yanofskybacteria bacterium GW2011_GWF2_43_596]KKT53470.1 MAG: Aspartyl/glutamyl-tRNA(Asn/Gln) amidotransferase subunit C [Candidatus Yanofskybacteria bacteri
MINLNSWVWPRNKARDGKSRFGRLEALPTQSISQSMITEKDVEHIAKLARIEISAAEREQLKDKLSSILGYIDQLDTLDTSNVIATYQTTGLENSLREDAPRESHDTSINLEDRLLSQAPTTENNFLKVNSIIDRNKK